MSDELAERVRALDAERARPDRREPTVEELLTRLIGTIHQVFRTPPDRRKETA